MTEDELKEAYRALRVAVFKHSLKNACVLCGWDNDFAHSFTGHKRDCPVPRWWILCKRGELDDDQP